MSAAHIKRWLTSLILLPPIVLLILFGGPVLFGILAVLISTVTLWEYFRIVYQDTEAPCPLFFPVWGYVCGALVVSAAAAGRVDALLPLIVLNILGAAIVSIFYFKTIQYAPTIVVKQTFGVLYIPFFLSFCVMLRNSTYGPLWVLFLLGIVIVGDSAAFYTGTYLGRHKLCPAVSPKKSIEGAIGGLVGSIFFALLFRYFFFNQTPIPWCIVFAAVIGIVGQLGDLFESEFKRAVEIKDSGGLLPGHGGFMDRLDALLFASPVAFLFKELFLP